ncbi:MAG: hypothetical protein AAF530_18205 [Pseudomonadota bacterium]
MSTNVTLAESTARLEEGAQNLLQGCLQIKGGERLLLISEDASLDHFAPEVADIVEAEAQKLGAQVFILKTPRVKGPEDFPKVIVGAMENADHTVFFSRIGDQLRFDALPGDGTKTMTYILDREYLASDFARLPHALMLEVRQKIHEVLDGGVAWRVTCPAGSDLSGYEPPRQPQSKGKKDFSLRLFPVTIFRPIAASSMQGKIVLSRWITSTDTHLHDPDVVRLDIPVTAQVADGRIRDFQGPASAVAKVRDYYDMVSRELGLDPEIVHSWHAGIHPKTFYNRRAADHPSRWGSVAYASPRHAHFHTCGDYAPGEIAWTLIDPTITFNGEIFWEAGRFTFLDRPDLQALLSKYPGWENAFEVRQDLGL